MNAPLTAKDFETDQEVRWRPGCGDYAILASPTCVGGGLKGRRGLGLSWGIIYLTSKSDSPIS